MLLIKEGKKGRPCVFISWCSLYFDMFFMSVASGRNLHPQVGRRGPRTPTGTRAHMQGVFWAPGPSVPGQQLIHLNPSTGQAGGPQSPSLPRGAILETTPNAGQRSNFHGPWTLLPWQAPSSLTKSISKK